MGNEDFILGVRPKSNHRRRLQSHFSNATFPLNRDPSAGPRIAQGALGSWLDRELLGREELLLVDRSIDDPLVFESIAARLGVDDRFHVIAIFEMGVDVLFPIQLPDDKVKVLMFVGWHILHQK